MVRLKELAGAAGVAMLAMAAVSALPALPNITVSFHPKFAEVVRVASAGTIDLAAGGQATQPAIQAPPPDAAIARQQDALTRLRYKIPSELYQYFDYYLYVSKAASGSLAQHMYIFTKDGAGNLAYEQSFPVSTGRERHEKYFTTTPTGLFELDPDRFKTMHWSRTWRARMPWAMFLNATIRGRQTGIALHSAGSHVSQLGSRASGGCVRLPPEKAAELFQRFQASARGYVPVFAFDTAKNRTSGEGRVVRGADGKPVLTYGYRVLLFIEDYDGSGPALVAIA